ncbi:unnamed protein product, partial [Iphiclides podalirius]
MSVECRAANKQRGSGQGGGGGGGSEVCLPRYLPAATTCMSLGDASAKKLTSVARARPLRSHAAARRREHVSKLSKRVPTLRDTIDCLPRERVLFPSCACFCGVDVVHGGLKMRGALQACWLALALAAAVAAQADTRHLSGQLLDKRTESTRTYRNLSKVQFEFVIRLGSDAWSRLPCDVVALNRYL